MLTFLQSLKKLKTSTEFQNFIKSNPHSYLSTAFTIYKKDWQINYYCPKKELFFIFSVNEKISIKKSKKFNKKEISKLDINKIKINYKQALEIIENYRNKKYPSEKPEKIIIILQNIQDKTIYNITYLTNNFKTLNFKLDTLNKKIISSHLKSIFEFRKKTKANFYT